MKALFPLLALALFCEVACSTSQSVPPKPIEISSDFADRTSDFSFEFLKKLHQKENSEKNFFVSPLGLHMALGMLMNGSATSSEQELLKTLKLEGLSIDEINANYLKLIEGLPLVDSKVTNLLANSVWQDVNFKTEQSYLDILKEHFKAELYKENFAQAATVNKINKWASDHTNGKIEKILEEISPDQVMFLINALYFKGDWANQFDTKQTYKTVFTGLNKSSQVDMMAKIDTFAFADFSNYKITELNYGSGQYSMVFVLPNTGIPLDNIIKNMNTSSWAQDLSKLKVQKIELEVPKLKMEYSIKLNDVLIEMGIPSIFNSAADLSKISPPAGKLKVGFVKQDSFVEIDEKGTEAAAVTTIGIEVTSVPSYPRFVCNKPFLFFIREKSSNTIQFMGKIVNL
jgi:serpin B